jgi:hypothetical protein
VKIMARAKDARGSAYLDLYVDNMLREASQFERLTKLPQALERKLMCDIVRVIAFAFEVSLLNLHRFNLLGKDVRRY